MFQGVSRTLIDVGAPRRAFSTNAWQRNYSHRCSLIARRIPNKALTEWASQLQRNAKESRATAAIYYTHILFASTRRKQNAFTMYFHFRDTWYLAAYVCKFAETILSRFKRDLSSKLDSIHRVREYRERTADTFAGRKSVCVSSWRGRHTITRMAIIKLVSWSRQRTAWRMVVDTIIYGTLR